MASLHSNRGAKRAREARAALGHTREGPLPDLLQVVEREGDAHVVLLDLPEGVAGAFIAKPGCPLLFVNGDQPISRQRFTLAHEFGHCRMGHASVVDEQIAISGKLRSPKEISANAFAAEFLMPKDAIAAWGRANVEGPATLEHVVLLAYEYGVSAQAARYALETAKVIDSKRGDQLDAEIAEEVHFEVAPRLGLEPLDDDLVDACTHLPRIPAALEGRAFGDFLVGAIDADELAARVGHDPGAVREMLTALKLDRLVPTAAG
ncbi:MAG: ImmA/IrrE family metallo-endopeptidase [Thermoleophilaceae bacterium]|nr:ImmA/IrrE family metallo-endopeptidase [Thermoleophilaceae bacterium]